MNLLYFFDWRLPDGMKVGDIDMEEAGIFTIVKKRPLQLVPLQQFNAIDGQSRKIYSAWLEFQHKTYSYLEFIAN